MTHAELVERAATWLQNRVNCRFAVTEQTALSGEIADAIGWKNGDQSHLIECKASRSDFLADKAKPFRQNPAKGMGLFRYYMTLPGLIAPDDLPPGWGLLEVQGRSVRVLVKPTRQPDRALRNEISLLVQCLAMAQANVPGPLHHWLTGPSSAYGKMRAERRADYQHGRRALKVHCVGCGASVGKWCQNSPGYVCGYRQAVVSGSADQLSLGVQA